MLPTTTAIDRPTLAAKVVNGSRRVSMTPIEVQLVGQGFDWLALWQTIGTVGAIPASVFGALWVQDLGRRSDARHRLNNQTLALIEIGERCVASVGRLHKRANAGTFKRDELGWLTEDAAAI